MTSNYTPPGSNAIYVVPDLYDPPDVPADLERFAAGLYAQGHRLADPVRQENTYEVPHGTSISINSVFNIAYVDFAPTSGKQFVYFVGGCQFSHLGAIRGYLRIVTTPTPDRAMQRWRDDSGSGTVSPNISGFSTAGGRYTLQLGNDSGSSSPAVIQRAWLECFTFTARR